MRSGAPGHVLRSEPAASSEVASVHQPASRRRVGAEKATTPKRRLAHQEVSAQRPTADDLFGGEEDPKMPLDVKPEQRRIQYESASQRATADDFFGGEDDPTEAA